VAETSARADSAADSTPQISEQRPDDIREAVSSIADQLCSTIDGDFDLQLQADTDDEQLLKLVMMVNFVLDRVRRTIDHLTEVQYNLEQRVQERTAELNLILDGSNDGVWVWQLEQDSIVLSRRWREMIDEGAGGMQKPDFWFERVHPRDIGRLRSAIAAHLDGVQPYLNVEYRMRHKRGVYRWMLCRGLAQRDDCGRPTLFAGTQSDITELRCVDAGSGLPNERSFEESLEDLLAEHAAVVVGLVSVDRMGSLAESLDSQSLATLRAAIRLRLLDHLPTRTQVCQLPGDTFGVVLHGHTPEQAVGTVLPALVESFRAPFTLEHQEPQWLALSIGALDLRNSMVSSVSDLLSQCWSAVRAARREDGSGLRLFDPALRVDASRQLAVENAVRQAISARTIEPFFQPIVTIGSGELRGFEALVRMRDSNGDWLAPDSFVPVIEDSELIVEVGRMMLEKAFEQMARWREGGWMPDSVFVSVNLAARQLADRSLPDTVLELLRQHALPAACVKLEVTETALMEHIDTAVAALGALRDTGVRIALDDFGTGYSSLEYLQRLPLDVLKIDRSFVQQLDSRHETRAIAGTVCSLAQLLGLEVVAEGVETRAEEQVLMGMHVPLVQGYLYSRPLAAADVNIGLLQTLRGNAV